MEYKIHHFKKGMMVHQDVGTCKYAYNITLEAVMARDIKGVGESMPLVLSRDTDEAEYINYTAAYGYEPDVTDSRTGRKYNLPTYWYDKIDISKLQISISAVEPGTHEAIEEVTEAGSYDSVTKTITVNPNRLLRTDGVMESREVDIDFCMTYTPQGEEPVSVHAYKRQASQSYSMEYSNYLFAIRVYDNSNNTYYQQEIVSKNNTYEEKVTKESSSIPWNVTQLNYHIEAIRTSVRKWDDGFEDPQSDHAVAPITSVEVADALQREVAKSSDTVWWSNIRKLSTGYGESVNINVTAGSYPYASSKSLSLFHQGQEYGITSYTITSSTQIPASGGSIEGVTIQFKCNGVWYTETYSFGTAASAGTRGTSYTDADAAGTPTDVCTKSITISKTDEYGTFTKNIEVVITQAPNTRTRKYNNDYTMWVSEVKGALSAAGGQISYQYNAWHTEYWHYASDADGDNETIYDICRVAVPNISGTRFSIAQGSTLDKEKGAENATIIVDHDRMGTSVGADGSATDTVELYFYKRGEGTASVQKTHSVTNYRTMVYLNPTFTLGTVADVKPDGQSVSAKPTISNIAQQYKYAFTSGEEEPNNPTYDIDHMEETSWRDVLFRRKNVDGTWMDSDWSATHTGFTSNSKTAELTKEVDRRQLGTLYVKVKSLNGSQEVGDFQLESEVKSVDVYQKANVSTTTYDGPYGGDSTIRYMYGTLKVNSLSYGTMNAHGDAVYPTVNMTLTRTPYTIEPWYAVVNTWTSGETSSGGTIGGGRDYSDEETLYASDLPASAFTYSNYDGGTYEGSINSDGAITGPNRGYTSYSGGMVFKARVDVSYEGKSDWHLTSVYQESNSMSASGSIATGVYSATVDTTDGSTISKDGANINVTVYQEKEPWETWTSGTYYFEDDIFNEEYSSATVQFSTDGVSYSNATWVSSTKKYQCSIGSNSSTSTRSVNVRWSIPSASSYSGSWSYTQSAAPSVESSITYVLSDGYVTVTNNYTSTVSVKPVIYTNASDSTAYWTGSAVSISSNGNQQLSFANSGNNNGKYLKLLVDDTTYINVGVVVETYNSGGDTTTYAGSAYDINKNYLREATCDTTGKIWYAPTINGYDYKGYYYSTSLANALDNFNGSNCDGTSTTFSFNDVGSQYRTVVFYYKHRDEDTTVYTYRIKFDANGGSTSASDITLSSLTATSDMTSRHYAERAGYSFGGWSSYSSSSSEHSRIVYMGTHDQAWGTATVTGGTWTISDYCSNTGTSVDSLQKVGTEKVLTLYAQWKDNLSGGGDSGGDSGSGSSNTLQITSFSYPTNLDWQYIPNTVSPSITVKYNGVDVTDSCSKTFTGDSSWATVNSDGTVTANEKNMGSRRSFTVYLTVSYAGQTDTASATVTQN